MTLSFQAESDRESGASSPEGGARAQMAEPRSPSPRARTPQHQQHMNGSMASMFQNLQNLANMQQNMPMSQQLQQQMSQQMSQLAANLQGLTSMPSNPVINSPLNLSVSAPGMGSPNPVGNSNMLPPAMPSPMPQLILASGQLVQGIQGAQLLIPTSQGIATQTILTIPVNHVNSNDQMVNLALNNGQVVSTSLANLQAMAQPHQLLNSNPQQPSNIRPNMLNPTLSNALLNPGLSNFLSNGATNAQELLQALQQQQQQPQGNHNLLQTVQQNNMPQQMQGRRSSSPRPERHYKERENFERFAGGSRERNERDNSGAVAMNNINRLASSNGEITITTSHANAGPASSAGSASSGPMPSPHPPVKLSPGSAKSPVQEENDLLADSPNQPTISQSSSNVVDGINLEDIKEFAKAFKLRRLGLGLTQTQVGQALSVTEGPAYSQSAICSALASQMLAAQLSSQQQNIRKPITHPSGDLRRGEEMCSWYASGQNHLTDFIGMEPSKKRKRRTSFTPQALELLNAHFERNTHPSGTEITGLAHQLGYEREVIRIWFCNKRQALKNTVRMMSKGMV
ncbi:POU domain, class 6, transcription factor 2 isoform X4 [Ostrinia furnacalis]|uniref:POU domain, class 6, transcription factor 2 isoform X4 n=1 Tax=Ostrinia furnacalis TaxID=93504 RepID=UPI00103D949B|nr:POU domain, class 6, transcription factor 2 isoform X4 [Ostrinia furnacalis]